MRPRTPVPIRCSAPPTLTTSRASPTTRVARAAALLAAAAVLLAGGPSFAAAERLLVGSAVSLREPVLAIAARFEVSDPAELDVTFGASSVIAAQIRAGAPIDLLISADEAIVDALDAAERLEPGGRARVAHNRLVVMANADRELALRRPEDLLRPEVRRIAVPEHAVPIGRYAREWLSRRGLLAQLAPRIIPTEHARATLAAVDLGHADAAIVYATDARVARSARVAFEIPPAEQPRIAYAAAIVAGTRQGAAARRFLRFLAGPVAGEILRAAGFSVPAAAPSAAPGAAQP
ncbi:MAG: molybdate ABC transporter substrate-binding protein [Deltaproteobacteria bacterium]|nr:MAG: molybdate ABC transporter substrate-binding protein [Deltaproteobacteria bacterium]